MKKVLSLALFGALFFSSIHAFAGRRSDNYVRGSAGAPVKGCARAAITQSCSTENLLPLTNCKGENSLEATCCCLAWKNKARSAQENEGHDEENE